jgi:hypothetical protein
MGGEARTEMVREKPESKDADKPHLFSFAESTASFETRRTA